MRALAARLFGRWQWDRPAWLVRVGAATTAGFRWLRARPKVAALVAAVMISGGGLAAWYFTRPQPHYVDYTVVAPSLTTYNDAGNAAITPMRVKFAEPIAPLSRIRTAITKGIDVSPAIAGSWFWANDKELQFTPQADWPIDVAVTVRLARKGVLTPGAAIKEYRFNFQTPAFAASITESKFYQDPVDPNLKKLVATVTFSHPVDTARFESHVSLAVAKDASYLGLGPDSRHFTVTYDKFKLAAYVHSSPLLMPNDDTPMTLAVDRGVRAARGGNDTPERLTSVVTIPGRASLRFDNAHMTVVDNAKYEPEQILLLASSSPVAERAFDGHVTVRLLPERHPQQPAEDTEPYQWEDPGEIGTDILGRSAAVNMSYVPSDEGGNTQHGFKFRAPVGRFLHVTVKDTVQGIGGYISAKPYVATVKVMPYPQALTFLGNGAVLPLAGDRRIGFLTRGISNVQLVVGRVLPNQLQHLASFMWNFARPDLYGDLEDKLVERVVMSRSYSNVAPGMPTYDSIDLAPYLKDMTQQRRGLFLLHVRSLDAADASGQGEGDDDAGARYRPAPEDRRLVLVTDLGTIVKEVKDGSRDVFVQSIASGTPVSGARVELVGVNGLPISTATTDGAGRARLPKPPTDFQPEQSPRMVVVQRDSDLAFLPFSSAGQTLDLSRFDTGGVENAASAQQLSAYLFSDRGIYRPGETVHLGVITRTADWRSSLAGMPLDVEVTDSRGTIVSRTPLTVSATSFDEVTFTGNDTAPTGTYEATAYLNRENKRRDVLGSTTFKVQAFEPDRMKVQLDVSTQPREGWLRPADAVARVTVAHLFGDPAGNRRVEGELSLTPVLPRFAKYPDHRFQIGEALKEPYHEPLAAVTTNDKGIADLNLDLKRFVGRAYRLNVLARAYEAEGGRNVAAENSAIVSDAPFLVGVKPDGDLAFIRRTSARSAQWLAVDQQLSPVGADGLTLEWVQRKFVSVLTSQGNGTLKYISRPKDIVRSTRNLRIEAGGTSLALPTNEPGDFMLVLRDASGAALNTLAYTVAGDANISRSLERNAELQVQLDKPSYSGGDTIQVSIRAPYVGAGLITVERDRVYHHQWFRTSTTSSVQRVTLPADFEGNGYVSVQFLRDMSSDELFMSPMSYGTAAFAPNLAARTQTVSVVAPQKLKPGTALKIRVAPGEPSRVVVVAVDEGILQVARYKNPDPLGYFFQKRMLEVRTTQTLDLILPDLKRFLALAAPGGDADAGFSKHLNPFNKKRKPAVAYWSGVIDVGPDGREVSYIVPDYFNGRLRVFAIASSARRVGVGVAATDVTGDFVLTPNVPTVVTPGDEFVVSVGVYNNTRDASPLRLDAQVGPGLSLMSASSADLAIATKAEGVAEFRLKATGTLGPASLIFAARRGAATARMEESVGVRPASPLRTQLTVGRFDGATATAALTRDMFPERRTVEASVSAVPLVWGQGLTAYLGDYQYSCTEQLVSKGLSALMVIAHPEFGAIKTGAASPSGATPATSSSATLAPTLAAIRSRMNDDGGLGLWSSTPETAEFPTIYAVHFLIEAREHGQSVSPDLLTGPNAWLMQFASTPASSLSGARMRAYAVYLLARQGIKSSGALSNVEQELTKRYPQTWATDLAAAYLAGTYQLMQRYADADRIVKVVPWSPQRKDTSDDVYYDGVVHDAQLLYLLAKHFPARLNATTPVALETISASVAKGQTSSLSAAYALLALEAFAKSANKSLTLGASEVGRDGKERPLTLPAGLMPKVKLSELAAQVKLSRRGAGPAYYAINETGFDKAAPTAAVSQGIEIVREFVNAAGNTVTKVAIGEDFFVRLRIRATSRDQLAQVAIVDLLPSGVESVLELRPPADSSAPASDPAMLRRRFLAGSLPVGVMEKSDWLPNHVDVRDDRLVLYGDVSKSAGTFVYRVRATNIGLFKVPPAFAEGMYRREFVAMSLGSTLEIVKR